MRIASLAPSVTEILYDMGAESEIVCSTHFCDYPEAARRLPKVGTWIQIDMEKLKATSPDIIFTSSIVQWRLTKQLQDLGFKTVNINPLRLHEVIESYNQIGQIIGRQQAAERLTAEMYKSIMQYHLLPIPSIRTKVYAEEWSYPPMVAGNWVPDLIELAGGEAVISRAGQISRQYSFEELRTQEPDVIVLHICGQSTRVDPSQVAHRAGWEELGAVKNQKIFVLDDSLLNRPTRRLFEGLKQLRILVQENAV